MYVALPTVKAPAPVHGRERSYAMNHTQGEWTIKENGRNETPSIRAKYPDNSGTQEVCRIKDTFGHTTMANAHLIAASPDMLEALKRVLYITHNDGIGLSDIGSNRVTFTADQMNEMGDLMRQVIAKAEGRVQ